MALVSLSERNEKLTTTAGRIQNFTTNIVLIRNLPWKGTEKVKTI